ncbi:MAG: pilus assembly protein, partial [Nitrospiraceae bacterium]
KEIQGIWEGGKQLALMAASARNLLTWVDTDNDGVVDAGEQIPFTTANSATLAPYLRAGASPFTADNIINFIRGEQVAGLRDRQVTVGAGLQVWKLGDPIHSTPTVVGVPKERFDLIYGDASYTAFFQQYRNRRQVAYVGANDGMLHAFNVGYYHRGDDPATTLDVEHGWFTRTAADNSGGPVLGQELWGFIPYQLLPQLQWLAKTDYSHVYYVDLKPKVVDARIFTPDADHPNGWGTVLIGGFRMGGSCGACTAGTGAPPMTVTADFGSGVQTRTFYSAYFALDITNPEQDPKLLWTFADSTLGLTTTYPTVLRVNPSADPKTDNTNAKWVVAVGSGPTAYNGSSVQPGRIFAINMATGPGIGNSLVSTFPTSDANAHMGDLISVDAELDYRADTAYLGNVINNGGGPDWAGKLYRLTTGGGSPNLSLWGIGSGGNRVPTALLTTFPSAGTTKVGPAAAAPTVTMDETSKLWVFFGTGRFYSTVDIGNTDAQHFFGVKDPVLTGVCVQATVTNCERPNLLDVSSATVCEICTGDQVTGVTGVTSLLGSSSTTLQGMVQSMDGWFTTLPALRERVVVSPTLLGGIVFFTSFIPTDDLCAGSGSGNLYGLFYLTGSAYKPAVIGATTVGSETIVNRSIDLGTAGMASSMAVHIGGQGTGGSGALSGSGCTGRVTGFIQSSTGTLSQFCANPALSTWSRYISWVSTRE